jgi:hypothetical protein
MEGNEHWSNFHNWTNVAGTRITGSRQGELSGDRRGRLPAGCFPLQSNCYLVLTGSCSAGATPISNM